MPLFVDLQIAQVCHLHLNIELSVNAVPIEEGCQVHCKTSSLFHECCLKLH